MWISRSESIVLAEDLETFEITFGSASTEMMGVVAARVFMAGADCRIPEPKDKGWLVKFGVHESQDLSKVLSELKTLFKPRLAVSYAYFGVKITICLNGKHSAVSEEWRYLTQFEPEDSKAFETDMAARLERIDLADFIEPRDLTTQNELEAKLAQAIMTTINLAGAAVGYVDVQCEPCKCSSA